jgi:hypothetical protein
MKAKVSVEAMKVTSVPDRNSPLSRKGAGPVMASGATASPFLNSISWVKPPRWTFSFSHSESALTTETPTPCRPPETL